MRDIYLIGAGLFNLTCARILAEKGYKCHIYDSRAYLGGNCADTVDATTGILYHIHGPHILHLDNLEVLNFLKRFGDWSYFHHEVKTCYKDNLYPMPINLETINKFFNLNLKPFELAAFLKSKAETKERINNMEDFLISEIGSELYEAFFKGYTIKQWGKNPSDLPTNTIARIPIRSNYQSTYYKKKYSFLPDDGYHSIFEKMVDHKNIYLTLSNQISNKEVFEYAKDDLTFYSGPIDKLFNYKYGDLEWRTVYFLMKYHNVQDMQGISVINYPESKFPYTRVCEPKHFYIDKYTKNRKSLLIEEYSKQFDKNTDDTPYYPIGDMENKKKFDTYKTEAVKYKNLYCVGRLGNYAYTDMENTVDNAFKLCQNIRV